jgi:hypothetical protein
MVQKKKQKNQNQKRKKEDVSYYNKILISLFL